MAGVQPTVLFLCADNSVRSQLGEAILRHHAGDRFEVQSAGLDPKPVHPLVGEVLREIGCDVQPLASKRVRSFLGSRVRYAVILREPDEKDAPRLFPFATRTLRWNVVDPAHDTTTGDEIERFRRVRDTIAAHVREWVSDIDAPASTHSAA
jgi:arsenate reductase